MCGKGTTQTSTQSKPQYVQNAQQQLVGQAQQVASTPYQPYTGQLVAPLNSTQTGATSSLANLQNAVSPYLNQAQSMYTSASQPISVNPLTSSSISQYESPYQQDVINSTMAQLQNQDAQQQTALQGNAIASGAWGGDRAGVAQAQLAGQQALANNSTLANLNNQNYTQALQTAQNQQNLQLQQGLGNAYTALQGASGLANLGSLTGSLGINTANSLFNMGTTGQQTAQNADTANYQQYLNQQQYPFQTTQYLSNILGQVAGQAGGTTTSSTSGNLLSDLLGTGGVLGSLLLNRGGAVVRRANGGQISSGYMPDSYLSNLSSFVNMLRTPQTNSDPLGTVAVTPNQMTDTGGSGGVLGTGQNTVGKALGSLANEGLAYLGLAKGGLVHGYADGGMPYSDASLADLGSFVPPNVVPIVPLSTQPQTNAAATGIAPSNDNSQSQTAAASGSPQPQVRSLADIANDQSWGTKALNNPLLNFGLATLAKSNDPNASAIGAGGLAALASIERQRQDEIGLAKEQHTENVSDEDLGIKKEDVELEAQRLQQQAEQFGKQLSFDQAKEVADQELRQQQLTQTAKYQQGELALQNAGSWQYAGVDPSSQRPILINSRTGQQMMGQTPIAAKPLGTGAASLSPDDAKRIAQQYVAGDHTVLAGLGYGNVGAQNRAQVQHAITEEMTAEGYSPSQIAERQASFSTAAKAFATGQQGNAIRSFNVGISHLNTLEGLAQALDNGNVQAINKAKNAFESQFGEAAPTNFEAAKSIVGAEIAKAIVGSGGALTDREELRDALNRASSWDQLAGAVNTYKSLMGGQLGGLRQQYHDTTGLNDFDQRLTPEARAVVHSNSTSSSAHQTVTTKAQYDALPSGTIYTGKDGKLYRKP